MAPLPLRAEDIGKIGIAFPPSVIGLIMKQVLWPAERLAQAGLDWIPSRRASRAFWLLLPMVVTKI